MYALFMECLRTSGMFTWTGDLLTPPHTKIDRPYWGVSQGEGNAANIFSDPLDAIEIVNLKLSQNTKKC
jgi:hypothetical protein